MSRTVASLPDGNGISLFPDDGRDPHRLSVSDGPFHPEYLAHPQSSLVPQVQNSVRHYLHTLFALQQGAGQGFPYGSFEACHRGLLDAHINLTRTGSLNPSDEGRVREGTRNSSFHPSHQTHQPSFPSSQPRPNRLDAFDARSLIQTSDVVRYSQPMNELNGAGSIIRPTFSSLQHQYTNSLRPQSLYGPIVNSFNTTSVTPSTTQAARTYYPYGSQYFNNQSGVETIERLFTPNDPAPPPDSSYIIISADSNNWLLPIYRPIDKMNFFTRGKELFFGDKHHWVKLNTNPDKPTGQGEAVIADFTLRWSLTVKSEFTQLAIITGILYDAATRLSGEPRAPQTKDILSHMAFRVTYQQTIFNVVPIHSLTDHGRSLLGQGQIEMGGMDTQHVSRGDWRY
ncbi:hypothetical protein TREMEDRAFT_65001 [Tremella mesenterica DSM 1558]|uniref:uncharacterized protein n=1 Tax=Tremella mesenterica (strain ATCC 24925 / CBS 8224 / DSM 1558 / NBRC 9311 / NRRL Y-6157 / RJB 2259-6 / UBC 559-6) TaxID=578456 RepID=UPI0003F4A27E|nr:uncharacterized protein TREMEDRAFT_65001 [Tremella mesenterica DSM 1558]EIW67132.1 hypothetical protein TREMEDRAFT_65001 [Tremella mesenterica DSM 1558]